MLPWQRKKLQQAQAQAQAEAATPDQKRQLFVQKLRLVWKKRRAAVIGQIKACVKFWRSQPAVFAKLKTVKEVCRWANEAEGKLLELQEYLQKFGGADAALAALISVVHECHGKAGAEKFLGDPDAREYLVEAVNVAIGELRWAVGA